MGPQTGAARALTNGLAHSKRGSVRTTRTGEGAAQRSGDRVSITAQLIEASGDRHLWAKSYVRDLRDVLVLQSEVAQAIAQEIQVKLTPQEQARLSSAHAVNPEAQEVYLRERYWDQKGPIGSSSLRGFDYFHRAVAKDSSYAAAYAALSVSYGHMIMGKIERRPTSRRATLAAAGRYDRCGWLTAAGLRTGEDRATRGCFSPRASTVLTTRCRVRRRNSRR